MYALTSELCLDIQGGMIVSLQFDESGEAHFDVLIDRRSPGSAYLFYTHEDEDISV